MLLMKKELKYGNLASYSMTDCINFIFNMVVSLWANILKINFVRCSLPIDNHINNFC